MGEEQVVLVVLDTNILFSAMISRHGTPGRIYDAWQDGRFELLTCHEQLDELRNASRYPKLRAILQPHLVGKMINTMQRATIIDGIPRKHTADDACDAYLLDLAAYAKAHYLVTGDKRSGMLRKRKVGGARILSAIDFWNDILKK